MPHKVFETLSQANAGLVDLYMTDYPFDQIKAAYNKVKFWTSMPASLIAKRVRWIFHRSCYQGAEIPAGCITQSRGQFPSDEWIKKFWHMAHELPDGNQLLWEVGGIHLLPVGQSQLAPLSTEHPAIRHKNMSIGDDFIIKAVCSILERHLNCNIVRTWFQPTKFLKQYIINISGPLAILDLLSTTKADQFAGISQQDRGHLANYMTMCLPSTAKITEDQRRVLGCLPIYKRYNTSELEPLNAIPSAAIKERRLARGFSQSEHPWLPQSVDLFADDQPMREHLRVMLSVSVLPESEYWHALVSTLAGRSESDWDAIMAKLAPSYHVHNKAFDLASILHKLPFVLTVAVADTQSKSSNPSPARRLSPESVVHPSLSAYFPNTASVFPAGICRESRQ